MASDKQIQANRINALKGGVKTEAGKAVSSRNAITHGILSKEALLPGESRYKLNRLRKQLMAELKPVGELETILVDRIIANTWRLQRVIRSEKIYGRTFEELLPNKERPIKTDYRWSSWQNHSRYEAAVERQLYRAVSKLEKLQADRRGVPVAPSPED